MDTELIKENLRRYYNSEAEIRDKSEKQEWKKKEREFFCARAKSEFKTALLEIGAGSGQDSEYFMKRGFTVTAVDLSREMVRICREKSINAFEMDFYNITELGKKFHCIWAMNCLLHVPKSDLRRVLYGINEVLEDGGLFFMGVYGGADVVRQKHDPDVCDTPRFFSFFTESNLKSILSKFLRFWNFRQYSFGG
jgi:2-polyprenyl-3-methyl-5-hydroxy-6-metoxy-1,4-benzoquinol methylase